MTIRAIVFDIGGILEIAPNGGESTAGFPQMLAQWEAQLHLQPGELNARLNQLDAHLKSMGKDGSLGTCLEEEWQEELRQAAGLNQMQLTIFMQDFWDVYLGKPNDELIAYFSGLRPRYQTALLSNSFVGARSREQERYHFDELTDLIIYSHEEGVAKPAQRIYALTCERLGVQPEEMIFLDDVETNVVAAGEFGIHAILFRDTAQAIADIQAHLQSNVSPQALSSLSLSGEHPIKISGVAQ